MQYKRKNVNCLVQMWTLSMNMIPFSYHLPSKQTKQLTYSLPEPWWRPSRPHKQVPVGQRSHLLPPAHHTSPLLRSRPVGTQNTRQHHTYRAVSRTGFQWLLCFPTSAGAWHCLSLLSQCQATYGLYYLFFTETSSTKWQTHQGYFLILYTKLATTATIQISQDISFLLFLLLF